MLEGTLAREHHGDLRVGLVAGLYCLVIIHGAPGLQYGGYPLLNTDIGSVPEGKEGVGYHDRVRQSGPVSLVFGINL